MAEMRTTDPTLRVEHDPAPARLSDAARAALTDLIGPLSPELAAIADETVTEVALEAGDVLFRRGDPADAAYVVVSGRLALSSAEHDLELAEHVFEEIGRGAVTGGAAVAGGGKRTATAFAARDGLLLRFSRAAIDVLAGTAPQTMLVLAAALLESVRPPTARPRRRSNRTITVIPASPGIDQRMLVTHLVERFSTTSAATAVTARSLGVPRADRDEMTRRLHEIEDAHDIVVYEAPDDGSAWTRRVLRQADRVLLVARADDPPGAVTRIGKRYASAVRAPIDVVLLHPAGTGMPRGTGRWLTGTGVANVHHLRAGSDGDLARLVRILSGRMTALVLGGGGARGLAHIGAIRALREAGVTIDAVAGSSIGAIMATIPGTELPSDRLEAIARERFRRTLDRTLPVVSLMKGKGVARGLTEQFGDIDIADLWVPTSLVTTNLTRCRVEPHRRGSVVRALRASTAIPGVFPPVAIDGELHIDGGVLNNLPIDLTRQRFPEARIVAVDVTPTEELDRHLPEELWQSGWSALWRRRPRARLPGLTETLVRATLAASTRDRDRLVADGAADLYVPLGMNDVDPLDFGPVADLARRGYEGALPLIRAWLTSLPDNEGGS